MSLFNYREFFAHDLEQLHQEGRYRTFADLEREMQSGIYCAYRKSNSGILLMQPTEDGPADNMSRGVDSA